MTFSKHGIIILDMEYWDIYDKDKQKTGRQMERNNWTLPDGEYHLTALAVVCRPDGKFLITQRTLAKHWGAGMWEVPGGGVLAGEESLDAAIREVGEETGLDVSGCDAQLMLTYRRDNPGTGDNYFVDVYRFVLDFDEGDVRLQREEADAFRLADADEIRAIAGKGAFLHYDSIEEVLAEGER